MLDLKIDELAATHREMERRLLGHGEQALVDFASETVEDLAFAVGPKTELQGKGAVTRDILRIVKPVQKGPVDPTPVSVIVGRRRRGGRITRNYKSKYPVRLSDYVRYRDEKHKWVGFSAGGYAEAARELGIALPGWMTDKPSPGSISIERSANGVHLAIVNDVPWVAFLPDALSRSGYAIQVKNGRLYDLSVGAFEAAARAAGF